MKALSTLDRGWQPIVDFKIGDTVGFCVPYFESNLSYIGVVKDILEDYAVIEYDKYDIGSPIRTHISLVDDNGYKRITKINITRK
jgi:hypothetical protein